MRGVLFFSFFFFNNNSVSKNVLTAFNAFDTVWFMGLSSSLTLSLF